MRTLRGGTCFSLISYWSQRDKFFRGAVQHFTDSVADDDIVFDPHTAEPRNINPGLDRHDVSGRKHRFAEHRNARRLMNLQADPVPEGMAVELVVPLLLDVPPGNRIEVARLYAGC